MIDRILSFRFAIEHMPGAKMGLVDYISRHQNQKAKKVSAYEEEFFVTKLNLISLSVNSLNLHFSQPASHLRILLQAHDLAPQITLKRNLQHNQ